jgi:hypothetical protein
MSCEVSDGAYIREVFEVFLMVSNECKIEVEELIEEDAVTLQYYDLDEDRR